MSGPVTTGDAPAQPAADAASVCDIESRGAVLHRDSLGSEQIIRPGELNLMTAGHGVVHAEETAGVYKGELHGVQLWVAQPSETRDGHPAFEHHPELPRVDIDRGAATVVVGDFLDKSSAARRDTEHVGVEFDLQSGRSAVPLSPRRVAARLDARSRLAVDVMRCG